MTVAIVTPRKRTDHMQIQNPKIDLAACRQLTKLDENVTEDFGFVSLARLLSTLFTECWLQYGICILADVRLVEPIVPSSLASLGCMLK